MAFALRTVGEDRYGFALRGERGPRLVLVSRTTSFTSGGAIAGRGLIGGSRTSAAVGGRNTLVSIVSQSGTAFAGSGLLTGGSPGGGGGSRGTFAI